MKIILWLLGIISVVDTVAQDPYPDAPASLAAIVKAEYFFDADPGTGNGTPLTITPAANISNFSTTITLNGSALTNGTHYLYLRTQDADGKWSLANVSFFENFLVPVYPSSGAASLLSAAEYFIDTDPGEGNGIPIALSSVTGASGINVMVDLTALSPAVHRIYIRARDAVGKWSITNYGVFDNSAQTPYPAAPAPTVSLTAMEYYFDSDPGFGNGNTIAIPASVDVSNFSFAVPLAGLSQGQHTLYLRSKANAWSMSAYAELTVGSVLPVSWLYVKGEAKNDAAQINWATGAEENTDKFIIEFSLDGKVFSTAGEVKAKDNANGSSYSFLHQHANSGAVYYRIRQLDKDGKSSYSKTIVLLFKKGLQSPIIFPNPAHEVVNLVLPPQQQAMRVSIYDASGRLLKKLDVRYASGIISIPINELGRGQYYIAIEGRTGRKNLPFIKQ